MPSRRRIIASRMTTTKPHPVSRESNVTTRGIETTTVKKSLNVNEKRSAIESGKEKENGNDNVKGKEKESAEIETSIVHENAKGIWIDIVTVTGCMFQIMMKLKSFQLITMTGRQSGTVERGRLAIVNFNFLISLEH